MDTRRYHKQLFDASQRLLPRNVSILCAVSGGPDSMALLYALHRLNELRKLGWRLSVGHLDHHLPPENSATMATFVRGHAQALGLTIHEEAIDVPTLSTTTGQSIEEAGRTARYEFLERAAIAEQAQFIAIAHHADDQAETVLHRILRGTSLKGLGGIPERRRLRPGSDLQVIRPLLSFTRQNIIDYLARREIPWMHDATNDDTTAATRNLIRHDLLPHIRNRLNPNVDAALVRLSKHARNAAEFISESADAAFDRAIACENCSEVTTLRVDVLVCLPPAILGEVLLLALHRMGAALKPLTAERIDAIATSLQSTVEKRTVQLPAEYHAERRGKYLYLRKTGDRFVAPLGTAESNKGGEF